LPFCDNSHEAEGWTCAGDGSWAHFGFCASYRYQNLVRKLASHYQGALCLPGEPLPAVDLLVTVVDGTDLELPLVLHRGIRARDRLVVTLGVAGGLLQEVFAGDRVLDLGHVDLFEAFRQVRAVLDGKAEPAATPCPVRLHSAFISHAVRDEALVVPAVGYLRRYYQADLFLCADSIAPGTDWQGTIGRALRGQAVFVGLLSEASLASHFCSFEIGVASALEKPIRLLSLDGSPPPVFVQYLQVIDLPRVARQRPWLDLQNILVDELLSALCESVGPIK
jgi:hypothetical protein